MKQINTIRKTGYRMMGVLFFILMGMYAHAQQTSGNVTKQPATAPGSAGNGATTLGGSVRVIDNKGTIKYLQVKNGITQITNSTLDANLNRGITTTWQLGGSLTDSTFIDVNGKAFGLDKITLVDTSTLKPSTNATSQSVHGTGTGYTFLVRNEATGETMKLLPAQFVSAGETIQSATSGADLVFSDPTVPGSYQKVLVYRNGVKLIANVDYTVTSGAVTVKFQGGTEPDDYAFVTGDKIEIHWIN